ncbi:MAG: hypothetical protein PHE52_00495 [Candidatus Pacebacteria bacterium]|nr:hypothetical protein [Candidatus Paceibacterota bacterium]
MSETKGISNGVDLLMSAVPEALRRCQYDSGSFYPRVGGIQGLTVLLTENDKDLRMTHRGIGQKTCEVIKTIRRLILEAVAQDAEQKLRAMGRWKGE